ncbi:MAG: extracellular solute-binding protein [Lachnospiraceae bacterium]|nr:extracellular solute-binding protein [Lachnospiraceae bacterium]
MKKRIALVLCTVLAVTSVLAGCGGGKQPTMDSSKDASGDAAPAAEPAPAADATEASGGDGVITFWDIATDEPDKTIWTWAVDQYNNNDASEFGYTVEQVATVNDQYKQKLSVAMSAGECPDAYIHWTGGPMIEYIKSGYAQDITEYVDQYGLRDLYTEASLAQCTYDGKIYALPVKNNSVAMFFYDKKMWADKGYEVPKTLDDLEALCDKMVADGITPFALANQPQWTGSMYYMYLVARHGGTDIIKDAYAGTGSLVNDSTIFAGQKIEEWVDKGYFPTGVNSLSPDNGDDRALLYQGAGMMLHGAWQVGSIKSENPDFYENLGAFAFPTIPDSKADQTAIVGTLGDNFISFNCTGDKLAAAVKWATYYSTDDFMNLDIEVGNVPPLKKASSTEPAWQDILAVLNQASDVQLWWDQYLPSSVADVHKSASQKCFDKSASPEDIAKEQQAALDEYLAENK